MTTSAGVYPLAGVPTGSPWENLGAGGTNFSPQFGPGSVTLTTDPWWGGRELIFGQAAASSISTGTLVTPTPMFDATLNEWVYSMVRLPTTANTGVPYAVSILPVASGEFGWFVTRGLVPMFSAASLAAGAALGYSSTTAGQAAANSAGRQLLGAYVAAPATTSFTRTVTLQANSNLARVDNDAGIVPGMAISGTGIPGATGVTALDQGGSRLILTANATANGRVTATFTYNRSGAIMNLVHINNGYTQGAIT